MEIKRRSLAQVHMAVLLFGLAGIFGKLITLPALIIVWGRVFFASVFLFAAIKLGRKELKLQAGLDYGFLLLLGAILALHWFSFFQSIQMSTVAIGLLTFSTFPIFTAFLEPVFFKEKLQGRDVAAAVITFLGVVLVVPEYNAGSRLLQGALWGILSGLTFVVLSILNRSYVKRYNSMVISFYQDLSAAVLLLPFLFILQPSFDLRNILLLILLGVVFTGVSHTLFISGLANVEARTASIIASLEPVYGILLAMVILREFPGIREIIGGIIILAVAFYSTLAADGL